MGRDATNSVRSEAAVTSTSEHSIDPAAAASKSTGLSYPFHSTTVVASAASKRWRAPGIQSEHMFVPSPTPGTTTATWRDSPNSPKPTRVVLFLGPIEKDLALAGQEGPEQPDPVGLDLGVRGSQVLPRHREVLGRTTGPEICSVHGHENTSRQCARTVTLARGPCLGDRGRRVLRAGHRAPTEGNAEHRGGRRRPALPPADLAAAGVARRSAPHGLGLGPAGDGPRPGLARGRAVPHRAQPRRRPPAGRGADRPAHRPSGTRRRPAHLARASSSSSPPASRRVAPPTRARRRGGSPASSSACWWSLSSVSVSAFVVPPRR